MSKTGFIKFISPEAAREIMRAVKFSFFFFKTFYEKKNIGKYGKKIELI